MTQSAMLHSLPLMGAAALSLIACEPQVATVELLDYPIVVLSSGEVDFGEVATGSSASRVIFLQNSGDLPMGVAALEEGPGQAGNFTVAFSPSEIVCPSEAGDTGTATTTTSAKGVLVGTGTTTTTTTGTGTTTTTTTTTTDTGEPAPEGLAFVLGGGCRIPLTITFSPNDLGLLYSSVEVRTVTQEVEGTTVDPEWYADVLHSREVVILSGTSVEDDGQIIVSPRFVDFGSVWEGLQDYRYVEVLNGGRGALTLSDPQLAVGCDESFSISWSYDAGTVLEPGASTFVEMSYVPSRLSGAYCVLEIVSDDPSRPVVEVDLQGNAGFDPTNTAPTVYIRSPEAGFRHVSGQAMVLELNMFDANQPADTLGCTVRSEILLGATLGSCASTDPSGHAYVDIDVSELPPGADAFVVQVVDGSEALGYASVPVLINTDYHPADDDHDGFADVDTGLGYDCNDQRVEVYPAAVEVADGLDNDCDTLVDENTLGYDDDGDTFSELEGDCDDLDDRSLPGAPESADHKDNDCDGIVDEGTALYDDDGDGFAEVNNDCDDRDPMVNPGAIELCDEIDNDCNGVKDKQDGCLATDTDPVVIGGLLLSQTAVEVGESLQASLFVYDGDGQALTYTWSLDQDGGSVDDATSPVVTWTAPSELTNTQGEIFSVRVVVRDEDGNQVWDYADVAVYGKDRLYKKFVKVTDAPPACSTVPGAMTALGALAAGLLVRRRRRE